MAATPVHDRPTRSRRCVQHALSLAMLLCFAGGWLGVQAVNGSRPRAVVAATVASRQAPKATTTRPRATQAIETIRLGQRVVGVNPLTHETQPAAVVGPQTHRAVRLTLRQHGVLYEIGLLRSLDWLQSAGAATGGTIDLSQTEIGVEGPAAVVSIAPCPPLEPDDGTGRMLVTGRFKHLAANVLDVSITGEERPLGVTDTHPTWSADRQQFVVAGQLRDGERLRSLTGHVTRVTRITPTRGPPQHVYNPGVDAQHVCHVTSTSLLAHNTCETITLYHGTSRSSHANLKQVGVLPVGADDGAFYFTDDAAAAARWADPHEPAVVNL